MEEPLDYDDMGMWACYPEHPADLCGTDLNATEIGADGARTVVRHEAAANPGLDCFYVYPTRAFRARYGVGTRDTP